MEDGRKLNLIHLCNMSTLFIIAGANGIGKTTATFDLIPPGIPVMDSNEIPKQLKVSGSANSNLYTGQNT